MKGFYAKMDKPIISFIIPVYNVKKTLERALSSIIEQDISDYEILLIDDGSTDGSGELAEELKEKYKKVNIKVFHKKNGGLSSARNYGLNYSLGKLVSFLDSDDYFLPGVFKRILPLFSDETLSVVCFGLVKGIVGAEKSLVPSSLRTTDKELVIRTMLESKSVDFYAWNKVYRRECFSNISFPEGVLYEDMVPVYEVMKNADKVEIIPECGIYYYQNSESIVYQAFNPKQYDNIDQRKLLLSAIRKDFPNLENLGLERLLDGYLSTGFKLTQTSNDSQRKKFLRQARLELRSIFPVLFKTKSVDTKKKMAAILLLTNAKLYNFLYRKVLKK